MKRYAIALMVGMAAFAVVGCHRESSAPATSGAAGSSASSGDVKTYKLRGKIISTNPKTGEATIQHDAIVGFMEAMTMPYKLKDPSILSELHPGDMITADVLVLPKYTGVYRHMLVGG